MQNGIEINNYFIVSKENYSPDLKHPIVLIAFKEVKNPLKVIRFLEDKYPNYSLIISNLGILTKIPYVEDEFDLNILKGLICIKDEVIENII